MRDIIESSDNNAVIAEYNGMYTVVDGSLLDGNFIITTGVQGLSPIERQVASGIDAAIETIGKKGLLDQNWEPVGEDA